jgi:hypothetical protein
MLKDGPMIPKVWGGRRERKGADEALDKILRSTAT